MGDKRCSALRASHEPCQEVDAGNSLLLVELLNGIPQFLADDRFVLTVNDNGIFVRPLPPLLVPVFPYIVAYFADVNRVVDDRFDSDATEGVPRLGLEPFRVQLVCHASQALSAPVHPEDFAHEFCFDVIDLQDGVLAASAFYLDYIVTENRIPFPLI
jgi:hypothetical protein